MIAYPFTEKTPSHVQEPPEAGRSGKAEGTTGIDRRGLDPAATWEVQVEEYDEQQTQGVPAQRDLALRLMQMDALTDTDVPLANKGDDPGGGECSHLLSLFLPPLISALFIRGIFHGAVPTRADASTAQRMAHGITMVERHYPGYSYRVLHDFQQTWVALHQRLSDIVEGVSPEHL